VEKKRRWGMRVEEEGRAGSGIDRMEDAGRRRGKVERRVREGLDKIPAVQTEMFWSEFGKEIQERKTYGSAE
jgi:hypothetical protein